MLRIKLFICALVVLSTSISAQETSSYVDMNADEFKSIVSKLVKAKRNTMTYKQYILYRQIQHYNKIRRKRSSQFQNNVASTPPSSVSNSDPRISEMAALLKKIQRDQKRLASTPGNKNAISEKDLEALENTLLEEIESLKSEMNDIPTSEKIVIQAPNEDTQDVSLYEQLANNMNEMNESMEKMQSKLNSSKANNSNNTDLIDQLAKMQKSIDKLERKIANSNSTKTSNQAIPNYDKELREIKAMISKIEIQKSTHKKETLHTNTISSNAHVEYLTGVIRGREISQIQFANASHALTTDSKNTIQAIAALLNQHEKIDVLIAGYTSSTGSPIYNQNLSLQRTEAVKRYLMELGIHATRIFSEYHGIDYNAADDSNARRVEMKLLVRK